jgi:hypothetical protein
MPSKCHKPREVVVKLRQGDILVARGKTVADAVRDRRDAGGAFLREAGFGGRKTDQVKRLKGLDQENARLRKAVPDLTLDKPILEEAAKLPEGQRQRTSEPRPPP